MLQVITVLEIAGVYALLALGLVMIYRTSRVLNLAQGELAIVCAYVAAVTTGAGLPWFLAIPVTLATGAIAGAVIYVSTMRPILGESPVVGIMTTVGVAILIRGLMVIAFGGDTTMLDSPFGDVVVLAGVEVGPEHLVVLGGSWGCVLLIILFNFYSSTGLLMRAVSDDVTLSAQRGIDVDRIVGIAWVLALVVGAVGRIPTWAARPDFDRGDADRRQCADRRLHRRNGQLSRRHRRRTDGGGGGVRHHSAR